MRQLIDVTFWYITVDAARDRKQEHLVIAALAREGIYAELVDGCIRTWVNGFRFEPIDYEMRGDLHELVRSDAISCMTDFSIVFLIPLGGENEGQPRVSLQRYLMRRC